MSGRLLAAGAFALEFAVEGAFGLAGGAGEALEGFLFIEVFLGLEAGELGGDGFAGSDCFPGLRSETRGTRQASNLMRLDYGAYRS